jgi:uncharacterized phage infection (PIP) family protein YhgE
MQWQQERMQWQPERMQSHLERMETQWQSKLTELAAAQTQTDKKLTEVAAAQAQTDKKLTELAAAQTQTDKKLTELAAAQAETDKLLQKTIKDNDKRYKELSKQIGGLGNKFGSFTEGMAFPSLSRLLQKRFNMEFIGTRIKRSHNGNKLELDVLAYTEGELNTAFIVEIKSHVRQEDLQQLLQTLQTFPVVFPEHADKQLYAILAAVDIPSNVKAKVLQKCIYLAMINDDQFKLRAPEKFQARSFGEVDKQED